MEVREAPGFELMTNALGYKNQQNRYGDIQFKTQERDEINWL
jgi:hypothetical protein